MSKGEVFIIPTDTVYGLATRLYDEEGLAKIYELKERDMAKQIPLLISSIHQIEDIAVYDDFTLKVMEIFWPGALTIVLPTTEAFKAKTGEETIAIRMPNHVKALEIIRVKGVLRVTSLNKSGEPPLRKKKEIMAAFGDKVSKIYWDGKPKKEQMPSTVAKVKEGEVEILRPGDITQADILSLKSNQFLF